MKAEFRKTFKKCRGIHELKIYLHAVESRVSHFHFFYSLEREQKSFRFISGNGKIKLSLCFIHSFLFHIFHSFRFCTRTCILYGCAAYENEQLYLIVYDLWIFRGNFAKFSLSCFENVLRNSKEISRNYKNLIFCSHPSF